MSAEGVSIPMALLRAACLVVAAVSAIGLGAVEASDSSSPNLVPRMELSYVDPSTGERVSCGEGCRRFEVPAGVDLDIRVSIQNTGGNPGSDGVSWDLWFDQRSHPFPGIDIAPCLDAEEGRVDIDCWQALFERVDWDSWDALNADRVCVPSEPGECGDVTLRVPMDAAFDGSRGRGVYSFAVWVDRYRVTTEVNEFDNYVGPIRVKVLPAVTTEVTGQSSEASPESQQTAGVSPVSAAVGSPPVVADPSSRPYTVLILPGRAEAGFALSSQRSRGTLEFVPVYAGAVTIEVVQAGAFENILVELRKLSTGEVLAEARGKGRIEITGELGPAHLKDDRLFEVVVRSDQGPRGARGTIAVKYPARAVYRRTE